MCSDKCFCAYALKRKQFWQGIESIWGLISAFEIKATLKKKSPNVIMTTVKNNQNQKMPTFYKAIKAAEAFMY